MRDNPSVNLIFEVDGHLLVIEGEPPVRLTPKVFAHLTRQFVKEAHELREILEPPYVVGLRAQHNVDGDQRTPLFTESWAFASKVEAESFLDWAQAEVRKFDVQWPFDLFLPAVPELNLWRYADPTEPAQALAEFRAICFQHFLTEAGEAYWNGLSLADRQTMWQLWAAGERLPEFDSAELQAWAAGQKELADL